MQYHPTLDLHTHTLSSGHATSCTITDMAKRAAACGITTLGISDHGPATLGSAKDSYFQNLAYAPRQRFGISLLYGVELNILDNNGTVDLSDDILERLDYAIISMHIPNRKPETAALNTDAYLHAMKHPKVKIIGHWDDCRYPIEIERFLHGCMDCKVFPEINNSSLRPDGYRGNTRPANIQLLQLCMEYRCPVILSSDSHGTEHIGDFTYALPLLEEIEFPQELVVSHNGI